MPTQVLGTYTSYSFNPDEEKVAQSFNFLQKCFLHNLRYEAVQERDNLIPDLEHPTDYFYKKAQLDGQIDCLTYLIDMDAEDTTTEV